MDRKLTLKLNQKIIERAKIYASQRNMSLSQIVEAYLKSLVSEKNSSDFEITPLVKSISKATKISADLDYKIEYSDYLNKKYK